MNKIVEELNLPGSNTRPIVINRKSSSNIKIELQLELEMLDEKDLNSGKYTE